MRKISMKRKNRTPNSETSDAKDDDKSGDESTNSPQDQDAADTANGSPSKKNKKNKRASKISNEENGTDKKSKKSKDDSEDQSKEEAEEQYEVERVLDDKMVRGSRHFLIRWKGYEEDSDTWEPESTLNCQDLIDEYLNSKDVDTPSKNKRGRKKKKDDSEDADEAGEYEVDKIIEVHHKRNGKREFLVHWKGYTHNDNTWEPEEHMSCPDLIEKFMSKVEKAKVADSRELRLHRQPTERFTLSMEQHGRKLSRRNLGKQRVQYHDKE